MEFDKKFRDVVEEVNKHASEPRTRDALCKYDNRALVFEVYKDATYVLYISATGLKYETNPPVVPDDMSIKTDLERAKKLVYEQKVGLRDIFSIKRKNVGLAEVEFIQSILKDYSLG